MKFWLKEGVLAKYEFKVQGTISFNGAFFTVSGNHTYAQSGVYSVQVTIAVPCGTERRV